MSTASIMTPPAVTDQGGKTLVTMRGVFPSAEILQEMVKFGAVEGGQQTLERLEEHLTGTEQVFIMRDFDAQRELVFKAWTDPDHLSRWFAPNGCTIEIGELDFREGGAFRLCIRNPAVHDCWTSGVYREIAVPEKIVYSMAITDERGNPREPVDAGMDPEWPRETVVTVTFAEHGEGTRLTLHQTVNEALARRTGAYPSWLQMLDHLNEEVKK